jgi:membrane-associated phospholipid phosphatase
VSAAAEAAGQSPLTARPWRRAIAWLAVLGPFFYLTYGTANWLASLHSDVPSIVFGWEHGIPFLGWTIIPYWSINAFYGISLLVCGTRDELDTHARRLLTAQVIAVTCFILFPLRFTFTQPETDGISGFLFAALTSFDKPFNQAPSLHIALLVILWVLYARHLPRWARLVLHPWFALVGVSVLTTYQHHFIDIPTGALLGFFCLWLWPDRGQSPVALFAITRDPKRRSLALRYLAGAAVMAIVAALGGGLWLWLLWPAVSLALIAANYAVFGASGFQKDADGRMSLAAKVMLAPYLVAAFFNSRAWTRHESTSVPVADGVALGRIPVSGEAKSFAAVVDLSAELPALHPGTTRALPMLDLVTPDPRRLREAAAAIEAARAGGPVLVCCALGYSRSASALATWLLVTGRAPDVDSAIAVIRAVRPRIVLSAAARDAIREATP